MTTAVAAEVRICCSCHPRRRKPRRGGLSGPTAAVKVATSCTPPRRRCPTRRRRHDALVAAGARRSSLPLSLQHHHSPSSVLPPCARNDTMSWAASATAYCLCVCASMSPRFYCLLHCSFRCCCFRCFCGLYIIAIVWMTGKAEHDTPHIAQKGAQRHHRPTQKHVWQRELFY